MKSYLLKALPLLSYFGGPFFISGVLKPHAPVQWLILLITGIPVGLTLFGADEMRLPRERGASRAIIRAGLVGLVIALFMHLYALWRLVGGPGTEYAWLHYLGIAAGMAWSVAYWLESRRWFGSHGTPAVGDGSSPKPIDPS